MEEGTRRPRSPSHDPKESVRLQLAAPVGVVITLVWAVSAAVGLLTQNFQGLEVVSPVMVIFVGYLFGINIVRTGEKSQSSATPTTRRR